MTQKINEHVQESSQMRRRRQKREKTVALGATILVLALVGVCMILFFVVKSAAGYVKDFMGTNETPDYFNNYLAPAVMFDPQPFDTISKANPQWEVETAIWAALDDGEKIGSYAISEDGREILPAKDVTTYLQKYFGDSVNPIFKTFSDQDFTYQFDKQEQCYYIPLSAVNDFYLPKVTKISRSFNNVTLTVEYLPGKNWDEDGNGEATRSTPDKTMDFLLTSNKGGYLIKAIKTDKSTPAVSSKLKS